ncbi:MAG TPA: ATPase domain-containing protein [archaeon]|nr:ATPase domain-containing protein [archaeon]
MKGDRVESGVPGMDPLMEGGFVKNSVYLIAGQTGTGKTIMCMQYLLQGLRLGESCLYLTMEQQVDDIMADMEKFGWKDEFQGYINKGKLIVHYQPPSSMDELREMTTNLARKNGATRFVLDSLSIATMGWKESSQDMGKIRMSIFNYIMALKRLGTTSLLITEIPESEVKSLSRFGFEEFLVDGVIVLHYLEYAAGGTPRSLIIRKMRRTNHGNDIYPFDIGKSGVKVSSVKSII